MKLLARARCWWLFAAALLLVGCSAPRNYAPEAPGYYDEYGGEVYEEGGYGGMAAGSSGDYDYSNDVAQTVTTAAPPPAAPGRARAERESIAGKNEFKKSAKRDERAAPEPKPVEASDSSATGSVEPEPLTAPVDEQPAPVSLKRQIIYTATMQVSVFDLDHALEIVEALPDRFGGWLHQRVDNQVILRIPAERLEQVMATVAELGIVDYRLLEALDVTAEYTDLESRIHVLEEMQKQLRALLEKAVSVEQALEIRRALDQITLELETARTQMRELAKSIAFSTLILRLVERGPGQDLPTSNDPFPWVDELGVEATDYR